MKLIYDLPALRPEVSSVLVYTAINLPVLRSGRAVGYATMNWAGQLELEIPSGLHASLTAGETKLAFVRTAVPKADVVCGRNQRLTHFHIIEKTHFAASSNPDNREALAKAV